MNKLARINKSTRTKILTNTYEDKCPNKFLEKEVVQLKISHSAEDLIYFIDNNSHYSF